MSSPRSTAVDWKAMYEQSQQELREPQENVRGLSLVEYLDELDNDTLAEAVEAPSSMKGEASISWTEIERPYCPTWLYRWHDFDEDHDRRFDGLVDFFGDSTPFPSKYYSEKSRSSGNYGPALGACQSILSSVLDPAGAGQHFLSDSEVPFAVGNYTEMHLRGKPDFWFVSKNPNRNILVGEVAPPHKLSSKTVEKVLSQAEPKFFRKLKLREKGSWSYSMSDSKYAENGEMNVARTICQAYDCMVNSGLDYSLILMGSALVSLKVSQTDPRELYYDFRAFPKGQRREARYTLVSYIVTQCLRAAELTPIRGMTMIWMRRTGIEDWAPPGFGMVMAGLRHMGDRPDWRAKFDARPPTMPYCTQACLRGLTLGGLIDSRCPNADMHSAACKNDRNRHPLTVDDLCARLFSQLAESLDKDCKCLDILGLYGRHGVLYKVALSGYGYTFVAKGVQSVHRHILEHEAEVYNELARFDSSIQGRLVPVFLGIIDLEEAIPHHITCIPHMMLMSYVGPGLSFRYETRLQLEAAGRDWDVEAERTTSELWAIGRLNDDVHTHNMAFNAETGRVMHFDFEEASVRFLVRRRQEKEKEKEKEKD